jgi:hypothetical protein
MSRNFTPDQSLIDQLQLNDTSAFEELHHRYCYPLYAYCNSKLHSPEDARRIVRDIFVSLWENRQTLPLDFSISLHLYLEVRKAVVNCISEKLNNNTDISTVEKKIIPGFSVAKLQPAKEPVRAGKSIQPGIPSFETNKRKQQEQWWSQYLLNFNMKNVRYAFLRMMHLW